MGTSGTGLPDLENLHAALGDIARHAGEIALRDFRRGFQTSASVEWKDGGSPVTSADHAVDAYLEAALGEIAPYAFHSEERPASWTGAPNQPAFVVDPIDGTRNFSTGGDAWCIVIGVLFEGRPVAGAVYMPARLELFSAFRDGGAFRNGVRLDVVGTEASPLRATGPRPIADWLGRRLGAEIIQAAPVPALAHRMLAPVKNHADLGLANGGGHDWDIVASDCILAEAGGQLVTRGGQAPAYRLVGSEHPPLIAASRALVKKIKGSLLTDPV